MGNKKKENKKINTMRNIRQTIIVRKDLNMRKGKIGSQSAHASMLSLLNMMNKEYIKDKHGNEYIRLVAEYGANGYLGEWLENSFTKICLGCDSEEELLELFKKADEAGLNPVLVTDNGVTEFNGVKTNTCIAIGPAPKEEIDKITSHLKPL
jgi:PTH2 family peptidyl-tRNA hydrolase